MFRFTNETVHLLLCSLHREQGCPSSILDCQAGVTALGGTAIDVAATLLLIRHAAHIHLDRKLSGRMPGVPLSDAGRVQAAALGRYLAGAGLTAVECSPLDRTCETAAAIAGAAGLSPPKCVDLLVEIDMGDWTGREFGTFGDDPAWTAWNAARGTARIPGGETMAEAQARIAAHLDTIARERDGETIALVTHADMIKAAVAHVLGLPLDNLLRFEIAPASVTRVVVGEWGAKLLSLNEKGH
jgi:broad specificity phosphatase PhoE